MVAVASARMVCFATGLDRLPAALTAVHCVPMWVCSGAALARSYLLHSVDLRNEIKRWQHVYFGGHRGIEQLARRHNLCAHCGCPSEQRQQRQQYRDPAPPSGV